MKRFALPLALLLVFSLGLGIRLYDLTDPPFDFHPTRQWRAALIARGMYFQALDEAPEPQRSIAIEQRNREALIEPPIVEWLASRIYLASGGVHLWAARVLSAIFWLLGSAAIFMLARDMTSTGGALIALVYFLFLPFGMIASRSFQPDPMMVALTAGALWMLHRWAHSPSWKYAVLAGVLSGLAILAKAVAIFPIGAAALLLVLFGRGLRRSLRDARTWVVAGLALLPVGLYYVNGLFLSGFLADQTGLRFFPQFWIDPAWYIRWVEMASDIAGFSVLLVGLAGLFLLQERTSRTLMAGLWLGYILYSFTFPYHTITHDYYQLPLIPIAALSLAPATSLVLEAIGKMTYAKTALAALAVLVAGAVLFKAWDTRVILARQDYRDEAAEWGRFQDIIPPEKSVIAITQAYGYPLAYYSWVTAEAWPSESDIALRALSGQTEEEIFNRKTDELRMYDYFLITNFNEFDRQPELADYLYENYEVYAQGDGYLIFDLQPRP